MICKYKKINTTQSDIMAVAENNFWNKCEPYYGLNDVEHTKRNKGRPIIRQIMQIKETLP